MSKVTVRDLAQAVVDLSATTPEDKLAQEVASYLVQERRTSELDAVMRQVARLRAQQDGIAEATITSARPLDPSIIREIKDILGAKEAVINTVIDKTVIGGVRVESDELLLDLTVRNRLNQLKRSTTNT